MFSLSTECNSSACMSSARPSEIITWGGKSMGKKRFNAAASQMQCLGSRQPLCPRFQFLEGRRCRQLETQTSSEGLGCAAITYFRRGNDVRGSTANLILRRLVSATYLPTASIIQFMPTSSHWFTAVNCAGSRFPLPYRNELPVPFSSSMAIIMPPRS